MRLHLITTDVSAFRLLDSLAGEAEPGCVVVPANRLHLPKIAVVREEATRRGVPVFVHGLREAFGSELPAADGAVSWMYSQIIRTEDLARYAKGTLNMHGGRIPAYRGANVLQWAIINGEAKLGVTWHEMVEEVDAGTIWAEGSVPIFPEATAWDVRGLMIEKGIELFPKAWRNMVSGRGGRVPDLSEGVVWPVRRPADGHILPGLTERRLRDLVRALCPPWPPAFVTSEGEDFPVGKVLAHDVPGTVPYETVEGTRVFLERAADKIP